MKKMNAVKTKVLLVYPGNKGRGFSFPMGLLYVARSLIQTGLDVSLLHLGIDSTSKIRHGDYLFVGISMLTGNMIKDGLKVAELIKNYNSKIPVVVGGVHPSLLAEETLKNRLVDIVVMGDGEATVKELAESMLGNKDLSKIKGIAFKNISGNIIVNPAREFINIDRIDTDLPYHLLGEYFISKTPVLPIHTSRGCPYRCGFCYSVAFHNRKYRQKSAENVVSEIEYYYKKYNILNYDFIYEDEFFIDVERVCEILRLIINKNLKIRWNAYCRFNTFDIAVKKYGDEFLSLLQKSGCNCLLFGAESGSQRLLDEIILKDIKIDQIYHAVNKMREYKISHRLNFMNCSPTETEKDIEATFNVIENISKNNPYLAVTMSNLAPLPGTSIFNLLIKEYGYKPPLTLDDWGEFNLPVDRKNINWLPKKHAKKCYAIVQMSTFPFHQDFNSYKHYRQFVHTTDYIYPLGYPGYLITKFQRFRYKKKFFGLMIEVLLFNKIKAFWISFSSYITNFILRKYISSNMYEILRKLAGHK